MTFQTNRFQLVDWLGHGCSLNFLLNTMYSRTLVKDHLAPWLGDHLAIKTAFTYSHTPFTALAITVCLSVCQCSIIFILFFGRPHIIAVC